MVQSFQHAINLITRSDKRIFYASTFSTNIFNAIEADIFCRDILIESINTNNEEYRNREEWQDIPKDQIVFFTYRIIGTEDLDVYYSNQNEFRHGRIFEEEYQAYDYYHREIQFALQRVDMDVKRKREELNLLTAYQQNMLNRKSVNYELWVEDTEVPQEEQQQTSQHDVR